MQATGGIRARQAPDPRQTADVGRLAALRSDDMWPVNSLDQQQQV
jgi:hypothetical protein